MVSSGGCMFWPPIGISIVGIALLSLTQFAFAAQQGNGEHLYVSKGCLGCHGASARGGVGPNLGRSRLSFQQFLDQLRKPRKLMPTFPHAIVSNEEARSIFDYLQRLPVLEPRLAEKAPQENLDPKTCSECHQKLHPTLVNQFHGSAMGRAGTQNPRVDLPQRQLTCADCHGTDHRLITLSKGRVPEATCGTCHQQIYKEHVTDAGHSYGPGPGDIGINWSRNVDIPHYRQMPRKVMEVSCDPCHAQAGATDDAYWSREAQAYIDTSSLDYRNGCMACHTRHSFDLAEARKPEACYTCHMGPDHPNYEAYMSSKHGSIYVARGSEWDWTKPMSEAQWDAPTCAYCHMLYVDGNGKRYSSHNMTRKIIWGMGVQAAAGQLEDITLQKHNQAKRNEMIKVCMTCHSETKARNYLAASDAHKLAGDALVVEAKDILAGLYNDGLITPSHGHQAAGLLEGPRYSAIELPTMFAQHWPAGLYFNVSAIEREYFDMFFFSNLKSYKGAFHMSPDYAWWYGYAEVLGHLARLRDEAESLRTADRTQKLTWFLFATGPLMVLLVIAVVWWLWNRFRRT
jgi:hydroxylamine dehydrogenase